jgi:hypothetical protein
MYFVLKSLNFVYIIPLYMFRTPLCPSSGASSAVFYDQISPRQQLQTHIQTDGNDIRPHTVQTPNERTSTEFSLVTA